MSDYEYIPQKCNICGSDRRAYLGKRCAASPSEAETSVFKCSSCGLIYPDPLPVPLKKKQQEIYGNREEYFSGDLSGYKKSVYSRTLKNLSKFLKIKGRLLDIGCGEGDFLEMAKDEGWDCRGIDISEEFARHAISRGLDVTAGNFEEMALPKDHFDVVVMYASLEHVIDPRRYLTEAGRVMKKNSVIYIKVPNEGSPLFYIGDSYNRLMSRRETTHLSVFHSPFHLYGFNKKSLRGVLDSLGFKILKLNVFNDGPSPLARHSTAMERVESAGYSALFGLCGLLGQGISIEVYALKE